MFNKQKYINEYNKNNYRSYKFRVKKDEDTVIENFARKRSINDYLYYLVWNDIANHAEHNFIYDLIKIDLLSYSKTMRNLIVRAEKADLKDDYGLYMNLADAIDSQAKKETTHNQMRESEWNNLVRRYRL